jgi:hypothetical protein
VLTDTAATVRPFHTVTVLPSRRETVTPLEEALCTAIGRSFTNFTQLLDYKSCGRPAAKEMATGGVGVTD